MIMLRVLSTIRWEALSVVQVPEMVIISDSVLALGDEDDDSEGDELREDDGVDEGELLGDEDGELLPEATNPIAPIVTPSWPALFSSAPCVPVTL